VNALKRKVKVTGVLLLAFLLLSYAAIHWIVRSDGFRIRIQSELSERTGYQVRIEDLRLSLGLSIVASDVSVSRDGRVLFQGKRIVCFLSPFDFFSGRISRLSLEKPLIHLSLRDLSSPSATTSPGLFIGALHIDEGEFVLETGRGEPFALRSISSSAENLSLGGQTALELRTYVPAVNGSAALSISGGPEERRAEIIIGQEQEKSPTRLLPEAGREKAVLKADFQMKKRDGDVYAVTGRGSIDQFRLGTEKIDGQFNALVELDAKAENVPLSLDFQVKRFPAKLLPGAVPLDAVPVSATFRGDYSTARNILTLRKIKVASTIATVSGGGTIALGKKKASVDATLRLADVALDLLKPLMPEPFREFVYSGTIAGDLKISGPYDNPVFAGLAWDDGATVEGKKFSVSQLSWKIPFQWARSSLQIKGGRLQGKDLVLGRTGETQVRVGEVSLLSDMVEGPQRPLETTAGFQILEGSFFIPGESKAGEHLNLKGRFACRDCDGDASFEGEARIESLQLLWNKFFGDFKDQKPAIKMEGDYRRTTDEIRLKQLHIWLSSMGFAELQGSVRQLLADPVFNLEIRSDHLRHASLYDFFIRDTFKASYPILGQIGVSGRSSVVLRAQGSRESFTVEGKLRLDQGGLQERSGGWSVGPVDLNLPFRFHFPRARKNDSKEPPPVGRLVIHESKFASSTTPEIRTSLVFWNNSLRFPEAIRLSLFGGACGVDKLGWRDVVVAPSDFSFSLGLHDLRVREMTDALGWYRFGGTLSGSIPEIHWAGDSLRSDGAITLNVFGGRVTVRAMGLERPFSPMRSIKMTAGLEGLDLEQVSESFEFGRISGILTGTIDDLVITQGQPAAFKADIQTVNKPGISQWISVEALNKITVLSSGSDASSFYGGLAGFFDFFRYSKLGFKAVLKNDKMTLRGVETRNGQEYLVVGTLLPPTVNIVSHTQEIGFSELMRRLERLQKAGSSG
jgi:hypothetical protein